MYAVKRKSGSRIATVAIVAVFTIVFASGLFSIFFGNMLNQFLHYLDGHIKFLSGVVKVIVFVSGAIWFISPIIIVCCIYTLVKSHRDSKKSSPNTTSKWGARVSKWLASRFDSPVFNPNFDEKDFDSFMKSELKNLQTDLMIRREEYLSMYDNGPLFLTEARDRFKNKMANLLDFQDEEILFMHNELHSKIKRQIRHYRKQMNNESLNDKASLDLIAEYSDQMDEFYSEMYAGFTDRLSALNFQIKALSDHHSDKLRNLSRSLSRY